MSSRYDQKGKEIGVICETTPPFQTPLEMRQLVAWTNQALTEKHLRPLLIVAVFVVSLLAIHPYIPPRWVRRGLTVTEH